jgi:hypothetical protein
VGVVVESTFENIFRSSANRIHRIGCLLQALERQEKVRLIYVAQILPLNCLMKVLEIVVELWEWVVRLGMAE